MATCWLIVLVVVGVIWTCPCRALDGHQPEQLHLSYPDDPTQMTVTWTTFDDTNSSICKYGEGSLYEFMAIGSSSQFVDGGIEHRTQWIHRVTLDGLTPGQRYFYHCGSDWGWSELFFFMALRPAGTSWSPRFALFGDMGNGNAHSMPFLQEDTQRGVYDAIIHVGDFAYDMDTDNGRVGDEFMRQIQPIAAYTPYMVCVGNHEQAYNFSNYKNRFSMPRTNDNMFFTFDIGPVHFISFSTEFYFFTQYGFRQIARQYHWLEDELRRANEPEARTRTPWIVTYGHRPMYCSNNNTDDCTDIDSVVRVGIPVLKWYGLEELFYKYGVDLSLWAHEHSYERLFPIYNREVMNGSYEEPYTNPGAPVHLTTGSAGCDEAHDDFRMDTPYYTAFRSADYGFTRMTVYNETHLHMEQISAEKKAAVIDDVWIVKDKHGPYDS